MGNSFLVRWAAGVAQASGASRSEAGSPPNDCAGEGKPPRSWMTRARGRSHAGRIALVKQSEQMPLEIHFLYPLACCFEPYQFAHESSSNKTLPSFPLDVTAIAHPPHFPTSRIADHFEPRRHPASAGPIKLGRHLLAQSFVRPLLIVGANPSLVASVLRSHALGRRSGHLGLKHPVHLFVRPIVLGMGGPDKVHRNAQAQPPHARPRETQGSVAPEGRAIVHPDRLRQTVAAKNGLERPPHRRLAWLGNKHHGQDITTEQIAHRERFAPPSIARAKPSFEIDRPHLVGTFGPLHSSPRQHRTPTRPSLALGDRAALPEPERQGAHRRKARARREPLLQHPLELLRAPVRTPCARLLQRLAPKRAMRFRAVIGPSRTVLEGPYSPLAPTLEPFVTALAADPKTTTQRREGFPFFPRSEDKSPPRLRHRKFFPRHSCPRKCHLCD